MNTALLIAIFLILLFITGKAAVLVVESSVSFGRIFKIKNFLVGFLLLGFATSSPEILVGVSSLSQKAPQLSLGNLLGASISLFSLVAGLAAFTSPNIKIFKKISRLNLILASIVVSSPLLLLIDGLLSRTDGFLIVLVYGMYLFSLRTPGTVKEFWLNSLSRGREVYLAAAKFITGFIILVLATKYIVEISLNLGEIFNIPMVIIGLVVLGIGTNLPELSLVFTAKKVNEKDLILGDVIGSAAFNTLLIGVFSIIMPISILSPIAVFTASIFLLATIIIFNLFAVSGHKISRLEGLLLILFYFSFLGTQLFVNNL